MKTFVIKTLCSTRTLTAVAVTGLFIVFTLLSKNVQANSQSIKFDQLGQYQLSFETLSLVNKVSGSNVVAQVTEKEGSEYSMSLPFNVQKINFLVANGQWVDKNQGIAQLSGKDVHHFLDEYQAAQQLFNNANSYYQSSLKLFNNKAIKQSQWLEISKNYFEAKLNLEHLNHFMSSLTITEDEQVTINAPIAGYLRFSSIGMVKQEGQLLFDVIPPSSLRLKVKLSNKNVDQLLEFSLDNNGCDFAVEITEKAVKNYNVIVWSEAIKPSCNLMLGETLVATPIYQQAAFSINKAAVFEFEDKNYIAIKKKKQLNLVAINILSATSDSYLISADKLLNNQEVLVSSVSAIQGVLLELGGE